MILVCYQIDGGIAHEKYCYTIDEAEDFIRASKECGFTAWIASQND